MKNLIEGNQTPFSKGKSKQSNRQYKVSTLDSGERVVVYEPDSKGNTLLRRLDSNGNNCLQIKEQNGLILLVKYPSNESETLNTEHKFLYDENNRLIKIEHWVDNQLVKEINEQPNITNT